MRFVYLAASATVLLALSGCGSSTPSGAPSQTADSSSAAAPSGTVSSAADTGGAGEPAPDPTDTAADPVAVEPVALPVAQSLLGFAAQASRERRGLDAADADAALFTVLRKSKKDWVQAAPLLVQEAQLRQVSVLVEGVAPDALRSRDVQVKDGIEITVFSETQACTVVANFVETLNGDTVMSWSEPSCADVS